MGRALWANAMGTSRRAFLLAAAALSACVRSPRAADPIAGPRDGIDGIERRVGGRVGVAALDTATGARIGHREGERFAMCSTFKWLLVACVLRQVDRGALALDRSIAFGPSDLLDYSDVTRAHATDGAMTVVALCDAALEVSDNTAANLLLREIGGPSAYTAFARSLGDRATRLDRGEPGLNLNGRGDPRDTTTPAAMLATMQRVLAGDALSPASRARLIDAMKRCRTGTHRLRAGFPSRWVVAHKTGTGERGASGDLAIAWPPGRAPVLVASYTSDSGADLDALDAAHASVARFVARALG